MNRLYYWDNERGLATIRQSPNAHNYLSVNEVKQWMATGEAPYPIEEPERCLGCGRAEQCECANCPFCFNGVPHPAWLGDLDNDLRNPTGTE